MEKRTYSSNFIKHFAVKIDFASEIDEFKNSIPENLILEIKKNFSVARPKLQVVESSFEISPNKAIREDRGFPQWTYVDDEDNNKITIQRRGIVFESKKYISFQDVKSKVYGFMKEVFKLSNIQISKISLKYINYLNQDQLEVKKLEDWLKYLNANLMSIIKFDGIENKISGIVNAFDLNYGDYMIKFKYGIVNNRFPLPATVHHLVLDFEGYTNAIITTFDELEESMEKVHDGIEELFESSIEEALRIKMNE